MIDTEEIDNIVKKLKSEYRLKGSVAEAFLSRIREALEIIEVSKKTMIADSEKQVMRNGSMEKLPYGITLDRFGYIKTHPAMDNWNTASNQLRSALKELGLKSEQGEQPGRKSSATGKIMQLTKNKAS